MRGSSTLLSVTIAFGAMVASAHAQTVITTPGATTYSGVVSEINPTSQVIILKPEGAATPVTYTYTPQTVFLDASGKTVSYESVRNVPVTVEYTTENGRTIVRRVVATKPVTQIIEKRVIEDDDD